METKLGNLHSPINADGRLAGVSMIMSSENNSQARQELAITKDDAEMVLKNRTAFEVNKL